MLATILIIGSFLAPQESRESGASTWADYDSDGTMDVLAVVPSGGLRLLSEVGQKGGFLSTSRARSVSEGAPGARVPLDSTVPGRGDAALAARDSAGGGTLRAEPPIVPPQGPPFDCVDSIADLASTGCLRASSVPTSGVLFPYPGSNNTFSGTCFVGGGENNQATYTWSTVGGGRFNTASHQGTTVSGGTVNSATGVLATVAGGTNNTACQAHSTVGGGILNLASGPVATVAGGNGNTAAGGGATAGGGLVNEASGFGSTVPGGFDNQASGKYSFAAGTHARAMHRGAFVWGDSTNTDKRSSAVDTFDVYCSGGATFYTNKAATTGVTLATGGGSWSMLSDRATKENVEPVNAREVLDQVCSVPIATWNYRAQDDSIRHMGPMAQDFHAAFGLGVSDKRIDTVDTDGVALAAIQGLNERLAEKDAEIVELRSRQAALEDRLAALEKQGGRR